MNRAVEGVDHTRAFSVAAAGVFSGTQRLFCEVDKPERCWICSDFTDQTGGIHADGGDADGGECLSSARLARGIDHHGMESALVIVPGSGWRNADPEIKASEVLIEWSSD